MSDQRDGGIGWTDQTWNPVRGCSRVSPGCEACYAETMAGRFCGPGQPYEGLVTIKRRKKPTPGDPSDYTITGARWTGKVRMVPEHLADPLRWKRRRRIFVNSMSDLFHERLGNEDIAAIFGVMARASGHTFQVLTKRAERMKEWFHWLDDKVGKFGDDSWRWADFCQLQAIAAGVPEKLMLHEVKGTLKCWNWPLVNVHLGVSVEDQKRADERIPLLLATPAVRRFISAEPLLGAVKLRTSWRKNPSCTFCDAAGNHYLKEGVLCPCGKQSMGLDWVIAGCESGPGARPTHPDWYRSLRDQCASAGVPFFLKQAKAEPDCSCGHAQRDHNDFEGCCRDCLCTASPSITASTWSTTKGGGVIAAPYLDGKQHLEFPR